MYSAYKKLPPSIRFLIAAVLLNLLEFTILRASFYLAFNDPGDPVPAGLLGMSMYLGLKFDFRVALLMNLPIFIASSMKHTSAFLNPRARKVWLTYLVAVNVFVALIFIFDFGNYSYVGDRLNVTTLRFLLNPLISLQMVWETYHVVWILLGLLAFMTAFSLLLIRLVPGLRAEPFPMTRRRRALTVGIAVFLVLGGLYGKFSYYPLKWSDAYFSTYQFASALSSNPVHFFFNTLMKKQKPYEKDKTREHYDAIADYLHVDKPDAATLNYARYTDFHPSSGRKKNVVVVILESFAHNKLGIFGNPLNPTPNFDALARKSIFFKRFYVPSIGTARSVFSFMTGLPDMETSHTSSRNPLLINQHTIINAFSGYEKYYFLGGSASWADIRGLMSYNVPDIHIYEEGSYNSDRVDVWGISDLSLFEESIRVLNGVKEPFFAIIQTSGFHRPYTIPDDNRGFTSVDVDEDVLHDDGFESLKEFNSLRFTDHSIGLFLDSLKDTSFYKDTIFVFFGDHGLHGYGGHIKPAEQQLKLKHQHVPLVIFIPGVTEEGRVEDKIASELDVLPTLAGLANTPYLNTTLGRDLLDPSLDDTRYAFTISEQDELPQLGLISQKFVYQMNADGSKRGLHLYDSETPREDVTEQYPETARKMELMIDAYYETARYMPYFNKNVTAQR
jgi:phosphoglycerol transferase MdoB-like AlkP superfamily enzyme